MKIVAIIPARLDSSRLSRKLLIKINGLEIIEHVRRRAILSNAFDSVYVATGDNEIENLVKYNKGNVIRTFKSHKNGTSRVAEAVNNIHATHIVLIQGDEPLILPNDLRKMVNIIKEKPEYDVFNAIAKIDEESCFDEQSEVKCAINEKGRILYCFRRSPSHKNKIEQYKYIRKMLGLICYSRETLKLIENCEESEIQEIESIEQILLISNNYDIYGVNIENCLPSVNTSNDIKRVLDFIENNPDQKNIIKEIMKL